MKKFDADPLYGNFEELGEDQVRTNLASGIYNERKANLARLWLDKKAQERADAFTREQIEIAREASDAASRAADSASNSADSARDMVRAARSANKRATIALIVALVLMAIEITRFALDWFQPNGGAP